MSGLKSYKGHFSIEKEGFKWCVLGKGLNYPVCLPLMFKVRVAVTTGNHNSADVLFHRTEGISRLGGLTVRAY